MKIKDLPPDKSLAGVKFIYPGDGKTYYWHGHWFKGVWGKLEPTDTRVYPLRIENLNECLEWEVVP